MSAVNQCTKETERIGGAAPKNEPATFGEETLFPWTVLRSPSSIGCRSFTPFGCSDPDAGYIHGRASVSAKHGDATLFTADPGTDPCFLGQVAQGVKVTPKLVQLLLRLVKEVREKKAIVSQHLDGVRNYYAHLDRLGLTEEDLLAYALVLGRDAD